MASEALALHLLHSLASHLQSMRMGHMALELPSPNEAHSLDGRPTKNATDGRCDEKQHYETKEHGKWDELNVRKREGEEDGGKAR